ncbi:MAG: acyl carrier protein [bacterium]|nr:acyl carrier protein [bacterium]
MLEKLKKIISEGLDIEEEKVVPEADFKNDLGADSLDLFELVMAFEEEFGIEIPTDDLEKMSTVGEVMNYIEEHL